MASSTIPPPPVADILALVERLRHRKSRPISASHNEFRADLRLTIGYLHYLACLLMISRRQDQSEPDQRLEDVLREYERIQSQTD
jgi:hypothetical protein